jgi:GNAT superfamily N-acetyltransferase
MDALVAPGSPQTPHAIDANLTGWDPVFERVEGTRLDELHGCARRLTVVVRLPMFNSISGVPQGPDPDRAIDELLAPFEAEGLPLTWWVLDSNETAERLSSRGFEVESIPGMAADLSSLAAMHLPVGVTLRHVDDDKDALKTAMEIAFMMNGLPAEAATPLFEAYAEYPGRETLLTFLVEVGGVPAATSTLFLNAGVAGIYSIGTLEEFRGKGLGTLVTLAAMQTARSVGYRVATLQSSPMGHSIYLKLGFVEHLSYTVAFRA